MKVEWTESAAKDIGNTLKYYEEQGVPETGRRLAVDILHKADRLARYPDSGRIVPEFGISFLRELIVPPFRIVYKRDPAKISIVRVWRSERSLKLD
jgi:toxin ParE1/3/4